MKLLLMLCGLCCLFLGARGQGYKKPLDMAHRNLHRRQLTPAQQTHILSDIQQHHHHRFNPPPHSPQQQFLVQQQPSLELSVAPTQRTVVNQRLPPPSQQSNGVRFPQNNFRNVQSPQNLNNQQLVQHHTQTNFVPNYAQQGQQLPQQQNAQFQRSLQNQLQTAQQNYQAENAAAPPQSSQPVPDQDFHAQNFITLRNHYAQTGQSIPSSSNPQFVQQQPQQQQQQFQAASQYSNAPFQGSQPLPVIPQQPIVPQPQVLPQVQTFQQPQVQTLQQTQGIQQSPVIPQASAVPTPQQIPFFQNNYQQNAVPQSQFSAAPQQQQIPFNNNQFQNSQYQQQLQQFQNQQQQQFQSNIPFQTAPQIPGSTLLTPEQEAKQKLIQKHEAFVQKQYEKQQSKVKQLHDEFVQKQQSLNKDYNPPRQSYYDQTNDNPRSRPLQPTEAHLFEHALRKYNEEHPTSPPPTTTTSKIVRVSGTEDPFERLLQAHRKDIYGQLKLETEKPKTTKSTKSRTKTKALGRDELLKQLRLALAETPQSSLGNKTFDSMDVTLPNGQKVQVIRTTDPNLIAGSSQNHIQLALNPQQQQQTRGSTSSRRGESKSGHADSIKNLVPSKPTEVVLPSGEKIEISPSSFPSSPSEKDIANLYSQSLSNEAQVISSDGPPSIEELARRGLIPEGYEIIQQPAPGSKPAAAPQPKQQAPPAKKKPTFVYLEEQSDGTFKIQGVKTNGEKEAKTSGAEVQSILERIQKGEIQLPPSVTKVELASDDNVRSSTTRRPHTTPRPQTTTPPPQTTPRGPTPPTVPIPIFTIPSSTVSPYSTLTPLVNRASTANLAAASNVRETTLTPTTSQTYYTSGYSSTPYSTEPPSTERLIATTLKETPPPPPPQPDLIQILKINGLFAMAKYLKQSGLDSILNETGPYTVFAPTDKAFKNLLIQLGGPERAEEKFKANPRLLSGLLLHHVIPGSFEISSLQDEMTGVSLAGTQLRVNQYTMHDQEWNDVLITTINGAMVVTDKQDIKIPQGIAHGVDRVMFPLPVGDLLQTLQSDRENRFTNFLKILYTSGMSEILQNKGTKTYTVFAPTDKAFATLSTTEDLEKLQSDKEAAQTFAMRHIVPGTLFSAGMRFYQVKDSLYDGKAITLQKTSAGKIKVNDAQMITSNIPATNGVIHALDGVL